jgi:hypothetical protein
MISITVSGDLELLLEHLDLALVELSFSLKVVSLHLQHVVSYLSLIRQLHFFLLAL